MTPEVEPTSSNPPARDWRAIHRFHALGHINLRRNPFGTPPDDERGALTLRHPHFSTWLDRLRHERFALQLIGEQGRGKSTQLRALHDEMERAPFVYLPEGEWRWVPPAPIAFVDEVQRMERWRRWLWVRACGALALGTHVDLRDELERAGYVVETVLIAGLSDERLAEILRRRVEWARVGEAPVPTVTAGGRAWLIERFGDDLRSIEGFLYEVYQGLEEPVSLDAARLERCVTTLPGMAP